LCSRERFERLTDDATALQRLTESMRGVTERGDWTQLRLLAHEGAGVRARLEDARELRTLAAAVYGASHEGPGTSALALGGVLDPRGAERERFAAEQRLRYLTQHDAGWASFYRRRLAHFVRLGEAAGPAALAVDADVLRQRVLAAIDRTDFVGVERMLEAAAPPASRPDPIAGGTCDDVARDDIDRPFDATTRDRAQQLGLEAIALPAEPALARCLGSWCRWEPDGGDPPQRGQWSDCGHPCPVRGRQALWESLNFLVVRPSATSAGTPYRPRFEAERMLVETFAEDDVDAPSALLELLGLPRRRALSRTTIERAIGRATVAVCDALALEPFAFTLALIPFDAYLRLAPSRGWGRQALWTHFDGYRVGADRVLWALVGGDARYGGADGLYGVGRDYDGEHLLARFAVLYRQRLL
jgi:hypothetical protein